jgi:hypothetical protein
MQINNFAQNKINNKVINLRDFLFSKVIVLYYKKQGIDIINIFNELKNNQSQNLNILVNMLENSQILFTDLIDIITFFSNKILQDLELNFETYNMQIEDINVFLQNSEIFINSLFELMGVNIQYIRSKLNDEYNIEEQQIKEYILSYIFEIIDINNADNTTMLLENLRDKLGYERIMYNDLINRINSMIKPENIIYHNELTDEEKIQIDYQNDIIIQESINESEKIINKVDSKRTFEEYNRNAKNIMKIINEDKNKKVFLSQNKPDNFVSGNLFSSNLVNEIVRLKYLLKFFYKIGC